MKTPLILLAMLVVACLALNGGAARADVGALQPVLADAPRLEPGGGEGYVALHFLADPSAPGASQHARQILAEAPRLAGIRHVFILAEGAQPAPALADVARPHLFTDPGDRAASAWGITSRPALVVLNPGGDILFRETTLGGNYPNFRTIAAQVEMRWRDPALGSYWITGGVAAGGHDPVAMVRDGRAQRGRSTHASSWQGLTYHFASAENRNAFALAPWRYVPAYGGWCATSMGDGELIEPNPENFLVHEGRLLLFSDGIFGNARDAWQADPRARRLRAEEAWAARRGVLLSR